MMDEKAKAVPIVAAGLSAQDLLASGENIREVRERLIAQVAEEFPGLLDEYTMASLRGEHTAVLTAIPAEHADAAPIIGRI